MATATYRYLGSKTYLIDDQTGSGQLWRGNGDEQPIPAECEPRFLEVYESVMELVSREGEPPPPSTTETVPPGTPYSTLSPEQIRALYQERTGKRANPRTAMAKLLAEIQQADLVAEQQAQADADSAGQADLLGDVPL